MPYTAQSQFATDITGYGRKMGRNAGLNEDRRMMAVVKLQGERQIEGTVSARTMNPGGSEIAGGSGLAGDYAPTDGRDDGIEGNPREDNLYNES